MNYSYLNEEEKEKMRQYPVQAININQRGISYSQIHNYPPQYQILDRNKHDLRMATTPLEESVGYFQNIHNPIADLLGQNGNSTQSHQNNHQGNINGNQYNRVLTNKPANQTQNENIPPVFESAQKRARSGVNFDTSKTGIAFEEQKGNNTNSQIKSASQKIKQSSLKGEQKPNDSEKGIPPEDQNFNFYHEYCRLFTASVVLTNQLKELVGIKSDLLLKFTKLEKKSEELGDQDGDDKKKRFRRIASQIDRHYKCPNSACQKSYGSEGSLNQHLKIKHPELYQGGPTNSIFDSEPISGCQDNIDSFQMQSCNYDMDNICKDESN